MRVISGTARGMKLFSPQEAEVRPMLDRVKESLFSIISAEIHGASVLDLFAGSGGLGIEALSRGAESCDFVERSRSAAAVLKKNLEKTRLADRARVIVRDVFLVIPALCEPNPTKGRTSSPRRYDLVFADPPYELVRRPETRQRLFETLSSIVERGMLDENALVVLHHEPCVASSWAVAGNKPFDERVYGRSQLTFIRIQPNKRPETAHAERVRSDNG